MVPQVQEVRGRCHCQSKFHGEAAGPVQGARGSGEEGWIRVQRNTDGGDPAADPNEPREVLGLIWETQEDRLMVDVKLNLGPKKAGLKLEEDVDLTSNIEEISRDSSLRENCRE
jgi:hypothetical protein